MSTLTLFWRCLRSKYLQSMYLLPLPCWWVCDVSQMLYQPCGGVVLMAVIPTWKLHTSPCHARQLDIKNQEADPNSIPTYLALWGVVITWQLKLTSCNYQASPVNGLWLLSSLTVAFGPALPGRILFFRLGHPATDRPHLVPAFETWYLFSSYSFWLLPCGRHCILPVYLVLSI